MESTDMKEHIERVVRERHPDVRELTWRPCDCGTCGGRDGTMFAVASPRSVVIAMRDRKASSNVMTVEITSWLALSGFCAHLLMLPNAERRAAAFVEELQAFWKAHVAS